MHFMTNLLSNLKQRSRKSVKQRSILKSGGRNPAAFLNALLLDALCIVTHWVCFLDRYILKLYLCSVQFCERLPHNCDILRKAHGTRRFLLGLLFLPYYLFLFKSSLRMILFSIALLNESRMY